MDAPRRARPSAGRPTIDLSARMKGMGQPQAAAGGKKKRKSKQQGNGKAPRPSRPSAGGWGMAVSREFEEFDERLVAGQVDMSAINDAVQEVIEDVGLEARDRGEYLKISGAADPDTPQQQRRNEEIRMQKRRELEQDLQRKKQQQQQQQQQRAPRASLPQARPSRLSQQQQPPARQQQPKPQAQPQPRPSRQQEGQRQAFVNPGYLRAAEPRTAEYSIPEEPERYGFDSDEEEEGDEFEGVEVDRIRSEPELDLSEPIDVEDVVLRPKEEQSWGQPVPIQDPSWRESVIGQMSARPSTASDGGSAVGLCRSCRQGPQTFLAVALSNHTECLNKLKQLEEQQATNRPPRNIVDNFGASALHFSARSGNVDMLQWLLETGTDPALRARNGATAAHDAAAAGQLACLQCILLYDDKLTHLPLYENDVYPIHLAAMFGQLDIVAWLVEKGFDPAGLPSGNGSTPLHYCAARGHTQLVRYLMNMMTPEQLDAQTNDGVTALYRAAEENQRDCVKVLHSVGASLDCFSEDGLLPVHAAARAGCTETLQLLLQLDPGCKNAQTPDGYSPMHVAAGYGHSKCMVALLDAANGKDVSKSPSWRDHHGNTPVHAAAKYGQMPSLNLFSERGIDLGSVNDDGKSPADLARDCHHTEAAIFLTLKA